ncbi:MAG: uncharacterized protein QG675_189 [Patescibacteria group bacterium]|jgi:uncharacterized protein (TIGR00251 family)|nr:uncharacterized protein [Patescibacteria group bacterium]
MKIQVYTKIGRREGLLGWDGDRITVGVDAPPIDSTANKRLVEILSDWTGVSKSNVVITKGHTSRYKTLDINIDAKQFDSLVADLPRLSQQQKLL